MSLYRSIHLPFNRTWKVSFNGTCPIKWDSCTKSSFDKFQETQIKGHVPLRDNISFSDKRTCPNKREHRYNRYTHGHKSCQYSLRALNQEIDHIAPNKPQKWKIWVLLPNVWAYWRLCPTPSWLNNIFLIFAKSDYPFFAHIALGIDKKASYLFCRPYFNDSKEKKITPKGSIDQELEHSEFLYHQLQLSCSISIKKHDAKTKQKTAVPNVNKQQQSGRKH